MLQLATEVRPVASSAHLVWIHRALDVHRVLCRCRGHAADVILGRGHAADGILGHRVF